MFMTLMESMGMTWIGVTVKQGRGNYLFRMVSICQIAMDMMMAIRAQVTRLSLCVWMLYASSIDVAMRRTSLLHDRPLAAT